MRRSTAARFGSCAEIFLFDRPRTQPPQTRSQLQTGNQPIRLDLNFLLFGTSECRLGIEQFKNISYAAFITTLVYFERQAGIFEQL